jgi:dinuclear metal center YbgI/SA1388 family protein
MSTVSDISRALFSWAPKSLAWEKDNIGIIVGDPSRTVRVILVALELTGDVLDEAISRVADLIVVHHPPIFHPLTSLREDIATQSLLMRTVREGVSVIAMHTNADAVSGGINTALASMLGLIDIRPLDGLNALKHRLTLRVSCDRDARASVLTSIAEKSVYHPVVLDDANDMIVLTMDVDEWRVAGEVDALRLVPGVRLLEYTRMPMQTGTMLHGLGAWGMLPREESAGAFTERVRGVLGAEHVRVSRGDTARAIRRVAVCGGSGATLISRAVAAGCDAFVTADLKYHDFTEYAHALLLIDAGHYETERVFIRTCATILSETHFPGSEKISIFTSAMDTNPIRFV